MTKSTSFRYNNNKYYWFLNGHIYLPNVEWDAIKLEGVFQEDISTYTCDKSDDCLPRREQPFNVPEFLFAEIEQQVLQVILNTLQIPSEDSDNKLNPHR